MTFIRTTAHLPGTAAAATRRRAVQSITVVNEREAPSFFAPIRRSSSAAFRPPARPTARGGNFIRIALFLSLHSKSQLPPPPSSMFHLMAACWPEVKEAHRGTRQSARSAGTKKTCFGCGRTRRTHSLGLKDRQSHRETRCDGRDGGSGKKPVLARTAYLLLARPSPRDVSLKLLSCLGISGWESEPETN